MIVRHSPRWSIIDSPYAVYFNFIQTTLYCPVNLPRHKASRISFQELFKKIILFQRRRAWATASAPSGRRTCSSWSPAPCAPGPSSQTGSRSEILRLWSFKTREYIQVHQKSCKGISRAPKTAEAGVGRPDLIKVSPEKLKKGKNPFVPEPKLARDIPIQYFISKWILSDNFMLDSATIVCVFFSSCEHT